VKHRTRRAVQLSVTRDSRFRGRSLGRGLVFVLLPALLIVLALTRLLWVANRSHHSDPMLSKGPGIAQASSVSFGDRFGDGTPDFLRLTDPSDQATFRRWFTLIADDAAGRAKANVPREITDCASLLRYAYREALRRHDGSWFTATGIEADAAPGEIRKWHYPDTPLGLALLRVRRGPFTPADVNDGAFAQFADTKTLVEQNAFLVSRDIRAALPGDLLFYRQFGHVSPWHSMIVTRGGSGAVVVYHTGPDHGRPGELRRMLVAELLDHPQPEWRPVPGNPNFLGVYRWNILRGTS
jgi:uncharacterized protein